LTSKLIDEDVEEERRQDRALKQSTANFEGIGRAGLVDGNETSGIIKHETVKQ
jgi:hypothetical protein